MKRSISLLLAFLIVGASFGQEDKSKKILESISDKTKEYKTITVSFTVTIMPAGQDPITQKGKAFLKGDKYKVILEDQEIYCDGTTITTYLKEENECYTSNVADNESEGIVSPGQIMTIWEDGYKSKYIKETTYAGKPAHHINLYPKEPKKSKLHTIILKIDIEKNEVVYAFLKGKDGTNTKYKLTKMEKNLDISDSKFIFNRAQHPGVECYEE